MKTLLAGVLMMRVHLNEPLPEVVKKKSDMSSYLAYYGGVDLDTSRDEVVERWKLAEHYAQEAKERGISQWPAIESLVAKAFD